MGAESLESAVNSVRELLRSKLESGNPDAAEPLQASLEEIDVLWQELQQHTEELAAERKRYAEFFEHAPDAYVITEPNGLIRQANRAAAELFGSSQATLAAKQIDGFVAGHEQQDFRARVIAARGHPEGDTVEWRSALASANGGGRSAQFSVRAMKVRRKNAAALCWRIRALD